MFESGVGAHAAGARYIPETAEGVSVFRVQDGGPGEPVVHHGVAQGQFGDLGDVGRNGSQLKSRSEEHTSELQSRPHLVCRLLLEKKNKTTSCYLYIKKKKNKNK